MHIPHVAEANIEEKIPENIPAPLKIVTLLPFLSWNIEPACIVRARELKIASEASNR